MNTIKSLVIDLFGTYTPITYNDGTSDIIPSGTAGVDWVWVAGVVLFAVSLYCCFRILGGIISRVDRR